MLVCEKCSKLRLVIEIIETLDVLRGNVDGGSFDRTRRADGRRRRNMTRTAVKAWAWIFLLISADRFAAAFGFFDGGKLRGGRG